MAEFPPCRHFASRPPSRCLAGRRAPHDCVCAAYAEDLACALSQDQKDAETRTAWANVLSGKQAE